MAVTWYLALVIAVVTLVPFEFQAPSSFRLVWFTTASDLIANVAFFVPFGFFVAFAHRGRPLLAGVALSVLVEFLQQFLPGRSPSALDVATPTAQLSAPYPPPLPGDPESAVWEGFTAFLPIEAVPAIR